MRTTINWQRLFLLWLPGVALALISSYYVLIRLHKVIYWHATKGTITDVVAEGSGDEWTYYEKAEFVDATGNRREAMAFSGVGAEEDASRGEVTILYDPADPSKATIFKWGDFLIGLLLPFAALLIYLGWPSDEEGVTNN